MPPERDEELSRLYREASRAEPPARIDEAILAAARRAAARPAQRPLPWWRRWAIPVSVTAIALLSASLTLLVSREQERTGLQAPPAPAIQAPPLPEIRREEGTPPAASVVRPEAAALPRPVQKARQPATPAAGFAVDPRRAEQTPLPAPEDSPGAPQEQRAPSATANGIEGSSAGAADARTAERETAAEPAPSMPAAAPAARAKSVAPLRDAAPDPGDPSPERRIERIRSLLREGRREEALQELRALRRAYPGHAIPPDVAGIEPR